MFHFFQVYEQPLLSEAKLADYLAKGNMTVKQKSPCSKGVTLAACPQFTETPGFEMQVSQHI